jgi:hypothetical protein
MKRFSPTGVVRQTRSAARVNVRSSTNGKEMLERQQVHDQS